MKVSIKQYSQTLFDLTDGKSEQEVLNIVKNFALSLKKRGQLKNASKIMEKFVEIYNAKNSIVSAEIITRYKIRDIEHKKIEDFLRVKYNAKSVEMKNVIDDNVKGGIIIRVGDEVMDASVAAQLKKLQKVLSS